MIYSAAAVQATKHHPKSVDLELVKQLIQKTKYNKLQHFLCKEFDAINSEHAGEYCQVCVVSDYELPRSRRLCGNMLMWSCEGPLKCSLHNPCLQSMKSDCVLQDV